MFTPDRLAGPLVVAPHALALIAREDPLIMLEPLGFEMGAPVGVEGLDQELFERPPEQARDVKIAHVPGAHDVGAEALNLFIDVRSILRDKDEVVVVVPGLTTPKEKAPLLRVVPIPGIQLVLRFVQDDEHRIVVGAWGRDLMQPPSLFSRNDPDLIVLHLQAVLLIEIRADLLRLKPELLRYDHGPTVRDVPHTMPRHVVTLPSSNAFAVNDLNHVLPQPGIMILTHLKIVRAMSKSP